MFSIDLQVHLALMQGITHHCKQKHGRYQFFSALAHTILAWEAGGINVCPSTVFTTRGNGISGGRLASELILSLYISIH